MAVGERGKLRDCDWRTCWLHVRVFTRGGRIDWKHRASCTMLPLYGICDNLACMHLNLERRFIPPNDSSCYCIKIKPSLPRAYNLNTFPDKSDESQVVPYSMCKCNLTFNGFVIKP